MENWIETITNKRVGFPDCPLDQICIEDIAHALSMTPRFAGHIKSFYSVASHSLFVCDWIERNGCTPDICLQALLHDATEAYLCDIPTPFKVMLPQYKELEDQLWKRICIRFNIPTTLYANVKYADRVALMTERDVLKPGGVMWQPEYENTPRGDSELVHTLGWDTWAVTKQRFLDKYTELDSRRNK